MTKASDVILVHGGWADGSSLSKVIPLLLGGGLRVTAVRLPLISLKDDVAAVKRAIALEDGPIILVGRSYGGVVITDEGRRLSKARTAIDRYSGTSRPGQGGPGHGEPSDRSLRHQHACSWLSDWGVKWNAVDAALGS
jgi:hypothetical protein